jgi:hypothetical protein
MRIILVYIDEFKTILRSESRVVMLNGYNKAIFIGCVHCDPSSLEWVLKRYANEPGTAIITVGDILDRGTFKSGLKCLDLLFKAKLHGGNVFICQTNHFTYHHIPYYPADFWDNLDDLGYLAFSELFDLLPYAVLTDNGVIACHGLPIINLADADNIKIGSSDWRTLTWCRLSDAMVTPAYIESVLSSNGGSIIIRSHDHYAPITTHHKKVLTFTTSRNLPNTRRLVVEVDLTKNINNIGDVNIIDIDREMLAR